MKGFTHWNYKPFTYEIYADERKSPIVCRTAPGHGILEFEWYDNGSDGTHRVFYRLLDELTWKSVEITDPVVLLCDLVDNMDYEFFVFCPETKRESRHKFARTGEYPGTVINYIHPKEKEINPLGYCPSSPTICRLPSGALLSGHDIWAPARPSNIAQLFRSEDEGKSWRYVTDLRPCLWPQLFIHHGVLYCLSCTMEYGDLQISRSDDEGKTWCAPIVLIPGGGFTEIGPHKAPVPVIEHEGRLYTGIEFGAWRIKDHQSTVLSIDADADLMCAENWHYGPFLHLDRTLPGVPEPLSCGYIEGNVVVGPDGVVRNLLRLDYPGEGKAALLRVNMQDPDAPEEFEAIIDCPLGANSKFELHQDPVTKKYIMIGTEHCKDVKYPGTENMSFHQRLILSMAVSDDLYTWKIVYRLYDYRTLDVATVGLQYPSWLISGNDIYVQTRAAFNGAETYHNGNCEVFSIIKDFRQYLN